MIIDATDLIVGRLAAFAAKSSLLGSTIDIVNCEKAVISGSRREIIERYVVKIQRGRPTKGPVMFRRPDMFVKRIVRGMLPHKQEKGMLAFKRIKCHLGIPENLKDKKVETINSANIEKLRVLKYMPIGELCGEIGRWRR